MTSTSVKESAVKVKLGTKSLSTPEEVPFFLVSTIIRSTLSSVVIYNNSRITML